MIKRFFISYLLLFVLNSFGGWVSDQDPKLMNLNFCSTHFAGMSNIVTLNAGGVHMYVDAERDPAIVSALQLAIRKDMIIHLEYVDDESKRIGTYKALINLQFKKQ